ncbi:MAG: DUF4339 domain-containing protein [Planctomycetes bacterium]|nr:DUF4339 domain-containing protein [Planctomycetota bacterium]
MAKTAEYYVTTGDVVRGPTTAQRLRQLAANGKLSKDTLIARGENSNSWFRAGDLAGLFDGDPADDSELIEGPFMALWIGFWVALKGSFAKIRTNIRESSARRAERRAAAEEAAQKAESVQKTELVKRRPETPAVIRPAKSADRSQCPFCCEDIARDARICRFCGEVLDPVLYRAKEDRAPVINIIHRTPKWHPGVAAFLSFLFPGLGQLYKGEVFRAIAWVGVVIMGYMCFLFPGVLAQLGCIVDAACGDPYE